MEPGKLNMKLRSFSFLLFFIKTTGSWWVQQGKKILEDLVVEGHRMAGKLVSDKF